MLSCGFFSVWFWLLIAVGSLVAIAAISALCVYCCKKCCWYVYYIDLMWEKSFYPRNKLRLTQNYNFLTDKINEVHLFESEKIKYCMFMLW